MESSLDGYATAFRQALAGWEELVGSLSTEEFNRRPAPGRWSVGQCLDHVNIVAGPYLPMLEAVVERGGPAGRPPFRYDFRGRAFIDGVAERVRRPRRTLKSMEPATAPLDPAATLATYRDNAARFLEILEAAEGLDLSRIRAGSPFLPRIPFLTFPVGALIEGCAGHDLRHLAQARRARVEGNEGVRGD